MVDIRNILFFSLTIIYASISAECIKEDSCSCQINENERIDISTILEDVKPDKNLNDTINTSPNHTITYTFFGCRGDPDNQNKSDPAVLIRSVLTFTNNTLSNSTVNNTVLGTRNQIRFTKENDNYLITFVNGSDKQIQPTITLLCDSFKQPFLKAVNDEHQKFVLSSPRVCIITENHGMSGGSIFLLILFIVASVYFIGGAVLLYLIRGARGPEMIPNVEFWKNLPGLVKDGVIFLLSGCRPNFVTTAETYDRI